ncbi:DNA-binding protein [uncultured Bacteroides sp.]|uniref:HU family DNA-binding protein n=1 Tax=uncultured Bacteroides sp. TaxID=162156 RepID=UPI00261127C2|nr:DNA-binding protein [uncultured Bacteroides sp.]
MSAYYDLFEKPDVRQTGEQQPLYARFIPKGTIDRKEFLNRVHLFTGINRSVLEGAMASFIDELCDCLADGWTVELGELGYFTPALACRREVMEKKELRAASVMLRGLNFRLGKKFYRKLDKKMQLERAPKSVGQSVSSASLLSVEQRFRLLDDYLRQEQPCINRAQYVRLTGRSVKQAITDLNLFIEEGLLMKCGAGRNVVYMRKS